MPLTAEVINKTPRLVTITLTADGKSINRNYSLGDHDMLGRVIQSTQLYFLNREFGRAAHGEYIRNRGQYEADAAVVRDALIAEEAA